MTAPGVTYGWCGVCKSRVPTQVLNGRLRKHRRGGQQCDGSLHVPAPWPTDAKAAS